MMKFEYKDLIGIPFVDGGRDYHGLDCYGLVMLIYARMGILLNEYNIAANDLVNVNKELVNHQNIWNKIENPEIGCVVLLSNGCSRSANHVGIYVGEDKFIHAYAYTGVCLSSLRRWKAHIIGYYLPPTEEV